MDKAGRIHKLDRHASKCTRQTQHDNCGRGHLYLRRGNRWVGRNEGKDLPCLDDDLLRTSSMREW